MKTKEEILKEHGISNNVHIFSSSSLLYNNVLASMEVYALLSIAESEAAKWQKFPDWIPNQPSKKLCTMRNGGIKIKVSSQSADWSDVIAFRELPPAYQGGGKS